MTGEGPDPIEPASSSERGSAVASALVGALLAWPVTILAAGIYAGALLSFLPSLGTGTPLWSDGEFILDGVLPTFLLGVPGLAFAAASLAGDRSRLAFLRGIGAAMGHAGLALVAMVLCVILNGYGWLLAYSVAGGAWAWVWKWGWRRLSAWRAVRRLE